ncbi:MAG: TRAP transporter large permease subunit [Rhodospirillaceae bacterium]|nr:TRAP transporter large permease subunit [Rhodospirillaceae bacterium]
MAGWREPKAAVDPAELLDPAGTARSPTLTAPGNAFTAAIDRISQFSGACVAYWTVIAVVVYFYEVVARYFLNSPTNWAHESMFLMFGMQYILAGAYAFLHDAHVRVDLFYARGSAATKAAVDILTFFAFVVFALAFIWTGWTFFSQSMNQNQFFFASGYYNEVSFTEWAVAYYPVKFVLVAGGLLLLAQGVSRLIKDLQTRRLHRYTVIESGGSGAGRYAPVERDRKAAAQASGLTLPTTQLGWVVLLGSVVLGFILFVEVMNVAFYDPYGDEHFLFTLQGTLAGVPIDTLSVLMFGSLLALLFCGLPLAFVTGSLGVVFIYMVGDQLMLNIIPTRIFPLMTDYQLSAIPLFIFMASMLERAGLIDEMFDVLYRWMGGLGGGLAIATIVASTILAAMVGVIGAAVVTMGIIALPAMLKRHYDPQIALGSIMAGGTLGILIPPSILAIIYAVVAQQSVGELYVGSVLPGLMLSGLYCLYVGVRTGINPTLGPALPKAERISMAEKLRLLRQMLAPVLLIAVVLGVIFSGAATPVEAAGIGSFGAMVVAAMHGRLTWQTVKEACLGTARASAMVLWIIFGATIFVGFYILQGGQHFVSEMILGTGLGPYGVLILMMVILVFLGMFLDWVGILLLAVPIFIPIVHQLEFSGVAGLPGVEHGDIALWFGVLYLVNMQMSFLSPPFGYALFYLRGVAPRSISTATIFKSSLPFLALQTLGLILCILFPQIVIWLPRLIYSPG